MVYRILQLIVMFIFYSFFQIGTIHAQSHQLFINEFMASNSKTIADEAGEYDDWIEIYNNSKDSINMSGLYFSDALNNPTKWLFPDVTIPAKGFLIIWTDADTGQGNLHTNFKLGAEGEQICIFDGSNFIDSLTFGQQKPDISYGRYPDGTDVWYFYVSSTPGSSNGSPNMQFSENPDATPPGGFFLDSVNVEISVSSPDANIYYTFDCSDPTKKSPVYTTPIRIKKTTVIRARTYEAGFNPSEIITVIYMINRDFDIATLSLVTDPPNLWDADHGIYVNPNKRGDAWERPVAVELYDPNNQLCFSANAGIRIGGEASRDYEKKAFRLYFRNEYGPSWLDYPLFQAKNEVDKFKRLSVHAGSTDMPANPLGYGWTLLRDPLMYELGRQTHCIYPANQPVAVYLNGQSWGIYNFMERIDKYFTESNFGELDVDLIENNTGARDGDMTEWNKLISFFESHDLSQETNYEKAKSFIDIQNFTNYHILEIFSGNGDWTHHNVFSYRLRRDGAVWRWILWDMDGCFGPYGVNHNTLEWATRENPATLILRKLLDNENYRFFFINRFADLLNSTFKFSHVNYLIDSLANVIRSDISFETDRWGSSSHSWEQDGVDGQLRDYAQNRPELVRHHIKYKFDLDGEVTLTIAPPQAGKGSVRVNSIIIDNYPWSGGYFKNIPIELEAIPAPNYLFKQWSDSTLPQTPNINIVLTEDFSIAAEFELAPLEAYLIINEINYNSAPDFDPGDWIELYNPASDTVDLNDWCFKDDDDAHKFLFPESTKIEPYGYLVLCQNQSAFHSHFPEVIHYIGDFEFGLGSNGEAVRIFNACWMLIDSIKYEADPPWPTAPDGNGPTLELIDPNLDNCVAENWQASNGYGTPGKPNSDPNSSANRSDGNSEVPFEVALYQNYPNPFNGNTQIYFDNSRSSFVQLRIYNMLGEKIKTIVKHWVPAGNHHVSWNSRDERGQPVPSGIYVYQLKANNFSRTKKMIITR